MRNQKHSDPLFAMPKERRVMPYVILLVILLVFTGLFIYNINININDSIFRT